LCSLFTHQQKEKKRKKQNTVRERWANRESKAQTPFDGEATRFCCDWHSGKSGQMWRKKKEVGIISGGGLLMCGEIGKRREGIRGRKELGPQRNNLGKARMSKTLAAYAGEGDMPNGASG